MSRKQQQSDSDENESDQEEPTHVVKIVLIGDSSVGKTNLLTRFCENEFAPDSMPTIGVEFGSKIVEINEQRIKAQIWDTAGQERFRSVTQAYYRGSVGAFIVYDITNPLSFRRLGDWYQEFKSQAEDNSIIMIIGNKCDLENDRKILQEDAEKFAKEHDILFMETSAKDGTNVEETFSKLMNKIYNVTIKPKLPVRRETLFLDSQFEKKKKCC
ncbi:ras and ef-hand domain-containing protein [Anaeramoeba ignava]|uniref:Ras and ef-hand domain-containing protein n=1 Tax=Anaeramoeba ignava TaxID=1746090 RepID=A0A9Q0RGH5_ANAIG|nr:ras and ef-hand domain-containing protein [Anaeramoeba ignava]